MESRGVDNDYESYELGVDLGDSVTVAAVRRGGVFRVATLGDSTPEIPSTVLIQPDGSFLVGDAAEGAAIEDQSRAIRRFKPRIGTAQPVMVGEVAYQSETLAAELIRGVVDRVSETEGGPPSRIAATCPADWTQGQVDRFRQASWSAGLGDVLVLPEPEAAAIRVDSLQPLVVGTNVAVFYLGDGDFSATILNRTSDGFRLVGEPQSVPGLGAAINEGTIGFIIALLGDRLDRIDADDPEVVAALARLSRALIDVKRKLSVEEGAALPVTIPSSRTTLWLTRSRFEQIVDPHIGQALDAMRRAVTDAMLSFDQIDVIVLAGENSQIPLVRERVRDEFRCPVAVEADPEFTAALGAARAAGAVPAGQSFELSPPVSSSEAAATALGSPSISGRLVGAGSARGRLSLLILVVLVAEIGLLIGLLLRDRSEPETPISRIFTAQFEGQASAEPDLGF